MHPLTPTLPDHRPTLSLFIYSVEDEAKINIPKVQYDGQFILTCCILYIKELPPKKTPNSQMRPKSFTLTVREIVPSAVAALN